MSRSLALKIPSSHVHCFKTKLYIHWHFNTNLTQYYYITSASINTNTGTIPSCSLLYKRTLSGSNKLKVGAVRCVASSSASTHVEDIDSRGSEACYHHAGGFGPCR